MTLALLLLLAGGWPAIVEQRPSGAVRLLTPGARLAQPALASPSQAPWVDANGWRLRRHPLQLHVYEDVPPGRLPLAVAEAYVYGGQAAIVASAAARPSIEAMIAFLATIDAPALPPVGDVFVVDDGSALIGEILNLMSRRNLCYHSGPAPRGQHLVVVKVGDPEFPLSAAHDPSDFAYRVRRKLTDERRSLRIYGSDLVLGYWTAGQQRARLHLLNYATEPAESFRVRLRGDWRVTRLASFEDPDAALEEISIFDGGIEFGVSKLSIYAVVDLEHP